MNILKKIIYLAYKNNNAGFYTIAMKVIKEITNNNQITSTVVGGSCECVCVDKFQHIIRLNACKNKPKCEEICTKNRFNIFSCQVIFSMTVNVNDIDLSPEDTYRDK